MTSRIQKGISTRLAIKGYHRHLQGVGRAKWRGNWHKNIFIAHLIFVRWSRDGSVHTIIHLHYLIIMECSLNEGIPVWTTSFPVTHLTKNAQNGVTFFNNRPKHTNRRKQITCIHLLWFDHPNLLLWHWWPRGLVVGGHWITVHFDNFSRFVPNQILS